MTEERQRDVEEKVSWGETAETQGERQTDTEQVTDKSRDTSAGPQREDVRHVCRERRGTVR